MPFYVKWRVGCKVHNDFLPPHLLIRTTFNVQSNSFLPPLYILYININRFVFYAFLLFYTKEWMIIWVVDNTTLILILLALNFNTTLCSSLTHVMRLQCTRKSQHVWCVKYKVANKMIMRVDHYHGYYDANWYKLQK